MRFSIVHFTRSWNEDEDESVISTIVEQSLLADELGFDGIFFPEHHFHGYSPPGSAPFQIGAYLASQLKRAWLGFSVIVVPLHHPVHLVEQMNVLDHLAKGKVLFGVGSGIHAEEALGFGNQYDYQIARMTTEALEIAEKLWDKRIDDPSVRFETQRYSGEVLERIVPAPYRKRRPLLMGVAGREASIVRAAVNGWPVFVDATDEGMARLRRYRQELAAANHPADVVARCLAWTTVTYQGMFIAQTDEEAFADMLATMDGHERFLQRQWPFIRNAERIGQVSEKLLRIRPPANSEAYYGRWCLWGSPDTVAAKIKQFQSAGIGNFLMSFNNGLYEQRRLESTRRGMELFVKEVMPRFRDEASPQIEFELDPGGAPETISSDRIAYI